MIQHSILSEEDYPMDVFPIHEEYLDLINEDVTQKMRWFAKGFYTVEMVEEKNQNFQFASRYARGC